MQPCPNCGRTEVTPAGNCQNCGMFRGNEAYGGAGYGAGYGQGQGHAYPPQDPWQAQPAAPAQYQQPAYGYPDPHAYPQQPQPSRRPSTLPLIVLSVVAVILVIGIVSVVVIRASRDDDSGTGGNGGTTASGVDRCVVGSWRVTSAKEKVEQQGTVVEFTARGGTVDLKADGTGKTDYGSGVVYTGRVSGQSVTITFTGSATFNFKTVDGSFTFSNPVANGSAAVKVNGTQTTSIPLTMDTKPAKYTCSGNRLTQTTDLATIEMTK